LILNKFNKIEKIKLEPWIKVYLCKVKRGCIDFKYNDKFINLIFLIKLDSFIDNDVHH